MTYPTRLPGTVMRFSRGHSKTEIGVIIHDMLTMSVVYVPGNLTDPASPDDPEAIQIVESGKAVDYTDPEDADPAWVWQVWQHIRKCGTGHFNRGELTRSWEMAAQIADMRLVALAATVSPTKLKEAYVQAAEAATATQWKDIAVRLGGGSDH